MKRFLCIKKNVFLVVVFTLFCSSVFAAPVKRLDFTGTTRTERLTITINDNEQTMDYITPSREIHYSIVDYDVTSEANGNKIITAVVVDPLYNYALEVLLYSNNYYADIRIGKRRIAFNDVREFKIVP